MHIPKSGRFMQCSVSVDYARGTPPQLKPFDVEMIAVDFLPPLRRRFVGGGEFFLLAHAFNALRLRLRLRRVAGAVKCGNGVGDFLMADPFAVDILGNAFFIIHRLPVLDIDHDQMRAIVEEIESDNSLAA